MTTQSLSRLPKPIRSGQIVDFRRTRSKTFALLAILSAAVLADSAPRSPEFKIGSAPHQADETGAKLVAAAAEAAPAPAPGKKIEALARFLATKYRVSANVTRDLVSTAYSEGARLGVDPLLIVAVMAVESRFNPIAESVSGAKGLMQVIPRYHPEKFTSADREEAALDPETNIQVGALILKEYIRRGGSLVAGLQMYNGAPGDASNAYANKVLGELQRLQQFLRRVRDSA